MGNISDTTTLIPNETFRKMYKRYSAYVKLNNRLPDSVNLKEDLTGDYVSGSKFADMVQRIINYAKGPAVYVNPPSTEAEQPPVEVPVNTEPRDFEGCSKVVLSIGNQNQCVVFLQQKLQDFGFYTATVDGVFGGITELAVEAFQSVTGHTPDGIVGPKTWSSIPTYQVVKPGVVEGDVWVLAELRKLGTINTLQDIRNVIAKYFKYVYYYDQQQSQYTTVTSRKGNCADLVNDVLLPACRALGLTCQGVHCQVRCLDGVWYGHYIGLVNGVKADIAGWAKGKSIDELICNNGYVFLHYEGNFIP